MTPVRTNRLRLGVFLAPFHPLDESPPGAGAGRGDQLVGT